MGWGVLHYRTSNSSCKKKKTHPNRRTYWVSETNYHSNIVTTREPTFTVRSPCKLEGSIFISSRLREKLEKKKRTKRFWRVWFSLTIFFFDIINYCNDRKWMSFFNKRWTHCKSYAYCFYPLRTSNILTAPSQVTEQFFVLNPEFGSIWCTMQCMWLASSSFRRGSSSIMSAWDRGCWWPHSQPQQ